MAEPSTISVNPIRMRVLRYINTSRSQFLTASRRLAVATGIAKRSSGASIRHMAAFMAMNHSHPNRRAIGLVSSDRSGDNSQVLSRSAARAPTMISSSVQ